MSDSITPQKGFCTVYKDSPKGEDPFQPVTEKQIRVLWDKAVDERNGFGTFFRTVGGGIVFVGKQVSKVTVVVHMGIEAVSISLDKKLADKIDAAYALGQRCTCGYCEVVMKTGLRQKTMTAINDTVAVRAGKGFLRSLPGIGHAMELGEKGVDVFGKLTKSQKVQMIENSSVVLWIGGKTGCRSAQGLIAALVGESDVVDTLTKYVGIAVIARNMED